jgi:hypothetical protein
MNAAEIAKALKGYRSGQGYVARCPAHDDRNPSLSVCDAPDGKVLVHCHGPCDQERVIATLRARGLWPEKGSRLHFRPAFRASANPQPVEPNSKPHRSALAIWEAALSAEGTLVQTYLASRGLVLTPQPNLRFHPGLKHPLGGFWPAMVALVTRGRDDAPLAIHRTFLARDGAGKAPLDPQKMMLGPCRGGALRLAPAREVLMVGEGIETCLAAMQASGYPAWAALSTSGLKTLDLPHGLFEIIVLADGDDSGEAAAQDCARRWQREGRRVRIARPPRGKDFNDLLSRRAPPVGESGQ